MSGINVTPGRFGKGQIKSKHLLIGVFGVIIIIMIATSLYSIDATERGVVTRFGKYRDTVTEGLHLKLPFGIDHVQKVTQQVLAKQFGFRTRQAGVTTTYDPGDFSHESEMLTGDLNIVDVTWTIEYRITDPRAWLFHVDDGFVNDKRLTRGEDNRDKTLRDVTQSIINQLVGDRAILDVTSSERDIIEFQSKEKIQSILDEYELGVVITEVKMQQAIAPKGEVQDAFEDVNKAVQDRDRLINEGEQAYYAEIPRIEGEAKQLLEEAEGYRTGRINRARGDVALFNAIYREYLLAPRVTRERLYYETMEKVFASGEHSDLVDKNLDNFLPLKQVGGEE